MQVTNYAGLLKQVAVLYRNLNRLTLEVINHIGTYATVGSHGDLCVSMFLLCLCGKLISCLFRFGL